MMNYDIRVKRIYSTASQSDGARVLVDRLWPRGKRREELLLSEWNRNAAPSTELRRNLHNNAIDATAFAIKYRRELREREESLIPLMRWARKGTLTLLTAARNPDESHLPILKKAIEEALEVEDRQDRQDEPSSPTCYASPEDL